MKMILVAAVIGLAACGGTAELGDQDPRDPRASAVCETNLDAGTPCDPCPGAISSEQIESPEWTTRRCGCRLANGGIAYVSWVSCGLPAAAENTCAKMLEVWNNSLCVH
jgi:hypothetical protein